MIRRVSVRGWAFTALATVLASLLAASSLAAEDEIRRAANGKPDLTGTYDAGTLTPLERPETYGDNLFLTEEEVEQIAAEAARRRADLHESSDPNREPPPVGGDGSGGGAGNVGGYSGVWRDLGIEASPVDGRFRTSIVVDPPNGRVPRLTEAGEARMAEQARRDRPNDGAAWWLETGGPGPYDGPETMPVTERCIVGFGGATPALPTIYNNQRRIVQTEDHVVILIEMNHDARIVHLNAEHPEPEERKWLGDSIGWWEGDTLVIDSRNFHARAMLVTLGVGRLETTRRFGATPESRVTERLTLQPDGDILFQFTVDDPSTWVGPWSGEYIWRRDSGRVYEYACHEGNYSMGGTLRGARVLEADAMAAKAAGGGSGD